MKLAMMVLFSNLPAVAAIVAAAVCAVYRVPGWGWFLFIAVCVSKTLHWNEGE